MIDDTYIIQLFYINDKLNHWKFKNIDPEVEHYLMNRFQDSLSLKETVYRIKYHYFEKPVCPICGQPVGFNGHSKNDPWLETCGNKSCKYKYAKIKRTQFYIENYGVTCSMCMQSVRDKAKQTFIEKYGVDNPNKCQEIKDKISQSWHNKSEKEMIEICNKRSQTNIERYGSENLFSSAYGKNKIAATNIERFGVDNPMKNPAIIDKANQTKIQRFGCTNVFNNSEIQYQARLSRLANYFHISINDLSDDDIHGLLSKMQSEIMSKPEVQQKIFESKKKNKSFGISGIEKVFTKFLDINYPEDFIFQYKSSQYPFKCDFYIKAIDLYIEIQANWMHGGKPFENTTSDNKLLDLWKSRINKPQYVEAINTWTVRDVRKRNIAYANGINYLEIFTDDINEAISIFKKYLKTHYGNK